jgi:glycosyltransferase involved in cell wall biosynthesis
MTWNGSDVTVVIPTYNRAALLEKAIASVLAQTVQVGAIVVVDDGSTDDSRERVLALSAQDPRIVLQAQSNAGANAARNAGIASATTALIAFLDSDDRWAPEKVARQLDALRSRSEAVASFTGILAVDGERPLYRYDIPADLTLEEIRRHNVLGTTSSLMVRTDVVRTIGGFDPNLPSCQDWDLYLRLRRTGPFATVLEDLVLYEDGPHERITNNPGKAVSGHEAVFARAGGCAIAWGTTSDPRRTRRGDDPSSPAAPEPAGCPAGGGAGGVSRSPPVPFPTADKNPSKS